jgi:MFS family permease
MGAEDKINKSLRYSLFDGMFASVMNGMSETFITPYAIAMKASASLIGILTALPNLASSLLQLKSATVVESLGSRKALIRRFILAHALMWIPIVAIPYIFPENQAILLVIFYTLLMSLSAFAAPAWSSLMADHVGETDRGKVFGKRNMIFGMINVSSMFLAGLILSLFKGILPFGDSSGSLKFLGFTIIFLIAFAARLVSWNFLNKMYEPVLIIKAEHRFTFRDFLKRILKSNFGRFVIFASCMNFSVYVVSPFFAVYMIRDLGFGYLTYTMIMMASTLTGLSMMHAWGRYADNAGNVRVLKLSSAFLPVIPFLWLISHNVIYLIAVQIFAGFFWAGFNLSLTNFIYDAVSPEKRTRCIAYFNVINGTAIFCGAAIGGYLASVLPMLSGYRILSLLVVSGILRLFASMLSSRVREVRAVKDISNIELFYSIMGLRPAMKESLSGSGGKE